MPGFVGCDETIERLYHYLDGELTEERRERDRRHLDFCGPCADASGSRPSCARSSPTAARTTCPDFADRAGRRRHSRDGAATASGRVAPVSVRAPGRPFRPPAPSALASRSSPTPGPGARPVSRHAVPTLVSVTESERSVAGDGAVAWAPAERAAALGRGRAKHARPLPARPPRSATSTS